MELCSIYCKHKLNYTWKQAFTLFSFPPKQAHFKWRTYKLSVDRQHKSCKMENCCTELCWLVSKCSYLSSRDVCPSLMHGCWHIGECLEKGYREDLKIMLSKRSQTDWDSQSLYLVFEKKSKWLREEDICYKRLFRHQWSMLGSCSPVAQWLSCMVWALGVSEYLSSSRVLGSCCLKSLIMAESSKL